MSDVDDLVAEKERLEAELAEFDMNIAVARALVDIITAVRKVHPEVNTAREALRLFGLDV